MELRQLEHFVATAEEGHFTRAARRCHIVQSGLSASIRTLERELGAELFTRSTRHVELTEAGRALLPEARRVLAAASGAADAVAAVEGVVRGTLSVGIMQNLDAISLPALLARFQSEHPELELRLRQAGSQVLVDELREGRLQIAFAALSGEPPRGLTRTVLFSERLALACPSGHPLAHRRRVNMQRLAEEPFVDFEPGWGTRIAVDRAFASADVQRRSACVVNDTTTLIDLVANGLGVAVVPPSLVAAGSGVSLVTISGSLSAYEVSVFAPAAVRLSAAARALLATVPEFVGRPSRPA